MSLDATVGGSSSNSYLIRTDADAYFANRFNVDKWTAATNTDKETALIMAAHRIDEEMFEGYPASTTQSMKWPRLWATRQDPLNTYYGGYYFGGSYYLATEIPPKLKDAQCELALVYINAGTTDPASPTGLENLKALTIGPLHLEMNQPVAAGILPDEVSRLLRGLRISSGSVQRG